MERVGELPGVNERQWFAKAQSKADLSQSSVAASDGDHCTAGTGEYNVPNFPKARRDWNSNSRRTGGDIESGEQPHTYSIVDANDL